MTHWQAIRKSLSALYAALFRYQPIARGDWTDEPIPCPACGSIECCGLNCGPSEESVARDWQGGAAEEE